MSSSSVVACLPSLALAVAFLAVSSLPAAEPRAPMIGFRLDGTGIFPADCKPPTDFDGVKGVNLVWRVALPNHSSSSPIVVGKRVFVVCAAGWPESQDCAVLLCFDADTGRELWRSELDEFAVMPEGQAKEARDVRKEYYGRIRLLNRLVFEYQSADDARKEGILKEAASIGVTKKECFDRNTWGTGSAEQQAFNDRDFSGKLRKVCGYSPITWSPSCLDINMPTPVSDGRRVFVYTGRRTVHAFDLDGHLLWQVWQSDAPYNGHYPEDLANSPMIVDGLLLMYCFDHLWAYELDTGKLRYKTESKVPHRHGMGHPVLLNLPLQNKAPSPAGAKTEQALYLWTGDLVRIRDGKILCKSVAPLSCAALSGDGIDRVFLGTHGGGSEAGGDRRDWMFPGEGQGGTLGVQFTLDGDTATASKLWFTPKNMTYKQLGAYPIFLNDCLWIDSGHVVDSQEGKAIFTPKQRLNFAYNGSILAGGHIYGIPESGINAGSGGAGGLGPARDITLECVVGKVGNRALGEVRKCPIEFFPKAITEPAKREQVIALTGRDRWHEFYGWHHAYVAPFASGNRLFIRTFDYLYCFGDKSLPFEPSKAFQPER